jgi:hypothetical protein
MTTAIPVRAVSGMLLLIGQAVPFLSHLESCGALLSGWEVSSHEMELTRKPPILIRFARHSGAHAGALSTKAKAPAGRSMTSSAEPLPMSQPRG